MPQSELDKHTSRILDETAIFTERQEKERENFRTKEEYEAHQAEKKAYKIQFCTDYAMELFDINETMASAFAKDWINNGSDEFNNFHAFVDSKINNAKQEL